MFSCIKTCFHKFHRSNTLPIIGILITYVVSRCLFLTFVPIWDAYDYYANCIYPAVRISFNLFHFNCFGHPSMIFGLIIGSLQYFNPGNRYLYHAALILVGAITIIFFYLLMNSVFYGKQYRKDNVLLTALFAFYPFIYANTIQLSLDQGVLLFFIMVIYFLIKNRLSLACLAGVCLVFTKEPGIFIYILTVFIYFCFYAKEKFFHYTQLLFIRTIRLFIPLLLFVIYIVMRMLLKESFLWDSLNGYTFHPSPAFNNQTLVTYMINIFILNFNWILTGIIILAFAKNIYILLKQRTLPAVGLANRNAVLFLTVLFFLLSYCLTVPKTYTNIRYFLPLYPLLFILFYFSLISLHMKNSQRTICLLIIFCIFFISNIYTFDPLSKQIYGTFQFGNHTLLKMTSINNECCGFGMDPLVYNTQFIYFDYLQTIVYQDIKPTNLTVIVTHDNANWQLQTRLDKKTFARTLESNDSFSPQYMLPKDIKNMKIKPKVIYFLAYPNMRNDESYAELLRTYKITYKKTYTISGYALQVTKMNLNN